MTRGYTLSEAHELLRGRAPAPQEADNGNRVVSVLPPLTVQAARAHVCRRVGIREDALVPGKRSRPSAGSDRSRGVSLARAQLARVLREVFDLDWTSIAREVGLSDHSSAVHAASRAAGHEQVMAELRQHFAFPGG